MRPRANDRHFAQQYMPWHCVYAAAISARTWCRIGRPMPRRARPDSDAAVLASRLIRRQGPDAFGCDRRSDSSSSLLARAIHDHFRGSPQNSPGWLAVSSWARLAICVNTRDLRKRLLISISRTLMGLASCKWKRIVGRKPTRKIGARGDLSMVTPLL